MHTKSARLIAGTLLTMSLSVLTTGALQAQETTQQEKKSSAAQNITGTWTMGLIADHIVPVALVLSQDGNNITGTMMLPAGNGDLPVKGDFTDGVLTLVATPSDPPPAGATMHMGSGPLNVKGTMQADGTFEGDLRRGERTMKWSAERLRPRRSPASPSKSADDKVVGITTSVAGNWEMSVQAGPNPVAASLTLKIDGAKVTGSLSSEHLGNMPLEGRLTDGTLTFSADQTGDAGSVHMEFSTKIQEDGTLAGDVTSPMGPMKWIAKRVAK